MTRRNAVLISLGALLLVMGPVARADSGFAGEWKGMSDGQASFTMLLSEEHGVLGGTIDIPAQGVSGAKVECQAEGDSLEGRFTFPDGSETTFSGKRAEDGSVTGTYEQGYNSGSFTMKRVEAAGSE